MTTKSLNTIRTEITGLQRELAKAEAAGRPVDDSLRDLAAQLDYLAEPYRVGIARSAAAAIAARQDGDASLYRELNLSFAGQDFAVGAIAALLGARILADLEAAVAAQASACPAPLDDTERDTALARLRRALRTLGREEEALIIAERAKGNAVARRPDADAGAVLGIPDGVLEEIGL